jgi:protein-L-isoaspartate(D-aspartate) O-methyltransferase
VLLLFSFYIFEPMNDLPKHKGLRNQLAALLAEKGIQNQAVLQAVKAVPRHLFMESSFEQYAYQDKPFPIGAGQTISQPYTVAFQTELLGVKAGDKVLEIGTGSGYQAAILCEMGIKVYSVERIKELFDHSSVLLRRLGFNLTQKYGDGYKGMPAFAPFDGIVVTAGAPFVPKALMEQLAVGGKLVIPVGEDSQVMTLITRLSDKKYKKEEKGLFRFVPMLKEKEK